MRRHHSAWIQRDAVTITRTGYWVKVQRATRWITIYSDGRRLRRFRAVVAAQPARLPGPWALHLTVLSDVLENFGGGPGRVAIHGRAPGADPSSVSYGRRGCWLALGVRMHGRRAQPDALLVR
jgi:hypothetical protein